MIISMLFWLIAYKIMENDKTSFDNMTFVLMLTAIFEMFGYILLIGVIFGGITNGI